MKIVYVNDALAIWGGLERILVEKVNYLADRCGYQVFVVTANQGAHPLPYPLSPLVSHVDLDIQFHQQYQQRGFRRLLLRRRLNGLFVSRLQKLLADVRPDVVVSLRPELTRLVVRAKGRLPLVFESHASRFAQRFVGAGLYERLKEVYYNLSVRSARMVVALTAGDAATWRRLNPHVAVIPNLVHQNDSGVYSSTEAKTAIFVGRFSAQKDIDSLLHIWQLVNSRHPDWQLHIYGGFGEEQQRLLPVIDRIAANISVFEPTADIIDKYCESSILLLTSRFEPFGLVLPEAMSCGLPVVAFDCPYGPADIITDGVDGFLIPGRDVSLFAERVCQLIAQPALRRSMGRAGMRSARRYAAEQVMPLWEQLFSQL